MLKAVDLAALSQRERARERQRERKKRPVVVFLEEHSSQSPDQDD